MASFVAGDVIADRYELISLLGEGGMGIVWRARDKRLARTVAVKLLSANMVGTDTARARLIREARAAAALEVDGIIRVYDVDELSDGGAFLVMELIRGKSLRARMAEGLAPARVVKIIAAAARALQSAHDAGVVHRDVKPDNIMLREDDRPIVVDFGIAKPVATEVLETAETLAGLTGSSVLTGAGAIVGTPAYLSPEQARSSSEVGPKTDQFALAVTMYEALSGGVSPWTGKTVVEVVAAILRDPPLPLPGSLPEGFEKVLTHAMSKTPEGRYPDMNTFATAVEAAGVGLTDRGLFSPSGTLSLFPRPPTKDAPAATSNADPTRVSTHGATTSKRAIEVTGASNPSRRPLIFAGIMIAVLVGLVFLMRRGTSTDPLTTSGVPSPNAFALGANGTTACPQFEVVGIEAAWLGASAAALACERVQLARGGLDKSTLTPAELAGVPREIAPSFPTHIYEAVKSRENALAASKERGARYLDGKLEKGTETYTATIVLRSPKGEELVRGEKAGVEVFEAVRGAMEPILAKRAPLTEEESKHLKDWLDVDNVDHALALLDVRTSIMIEDPILIRGMCKAYEDRAEKDRQPARVSYFAKAACKRKLRTDNDLGTPPELDESTPGALMTTSLALGTSGGSAIVKDRAAKLEAARSKDPGIAAEDRARLMAVAAELYNLISDDRARDMSRLAILASPKATDWRASGWHRIAFSSSGDSSLGATLTAWHPWEPVSQSQWGIRQPRVQADGGLNATYGESVMRSYLLSRRGPYAQGYGTELLESGDIEAARGVAEIAEDPVIKMEIMQADASYGAVLKKVPELIRELPRNNENAALAYRLSYQGVRAATILDRPADWMEDVVNGYVLSEPHHIVDGVNPVVSLIHACLFAPKAIAKKCIDRIEQLRKDGSLPTIFSTLETVLAGGVKFVEEDYVGATKIWRTLLRSVGWVQGPLREPLAIAFEKAGESELAEEVDSPIVALVDLPRTADTSWVRAAKRAYKRGDNERAKRLATAVVDKWRFADESPKGAAEMKELLTKLPH